LGVLAYAVLTHPQEAIAAIVWFSLVNWWMKRTGNLWDCVLVHAVTNGLLGAWILYSGQWRLW
jgi:membrane protease YdiL (CAAX protease family)